VPTCKKTLSRQSLLFIGAETWNSVPDMIQSEKYKFRKKFTQYLVQSYRNQSYFIRISNYWKFNELRFIKVMQHNAWLNLQCFSFFMLFLCVKRDSSAGGQPDCQQIAKIWADCCPHQMQSVPFTCFVLWLI